MSPLLAARGLTHTFHRRRGLGRRVSVRAVDGVDLDLERGECLALVGESGCGKTTLARCLSRLIEPDHGQVEFDGVDLLALEAPALRRMRRRIRMVFQSSSQAFDPRQTVGSAVAEPLRVHRLATGPEAAERVVALLDRVGLAASLGARYPHQLSGGQRQRVALARALATEPDLLILDEPVSALDLSERARILALLGDLRRQLGTTLLMITHDLATVGHVADRLAVMLEGRLVEEGATQPLLETPRHPYSRTLLAAVPQTDPSGRRRRRAG